jgi:hypothetical protein
MGHYARMGFIRSVLAVMLIAGCGGFLWLVGYTIKTIFEDFGPWAGVGATACLAIGGIALGFLHDTRPPREPWQ